jgi:endonuclease/exonuclease/phosphatase family metal-dependent hydrolase
MKYSDYPRPVVEDIVRLRRVLKKINLPVKQVDTNLLIATWNLRNFGPVYPQWKENAKSPKRNLRALAYIAEIIRHFDVIAIQEVKRNTSGIRLLVDEFLGPNWGLIMSDVSAGDKGNEERLSFVYDRRRVQLMGVAGEIVIPPPAQGNPVEQFDRSPYIVAFQSGGQTFSLLTAHIRYGKAPTDRANEIRSLAQYTATEIRDRAKSDGEENNLIILGDFNIDERGDNPLFQEFRSTGLMVPEQLQGLKTTYSAQDKFYDQIAWFMGGLDLLTTSRAGTVDFTDAIYKEMPPVQMSYRISDHFPLWVEFLMDRSAEQMAKTLQVDPTMPDPFAGVPD